MIGVGSQDNNALIDWVCPVNWLEPLNRGLIGWWLAVPGAIGGRKLLDLCKRTDGTLANTDMAACWRVPFRLGGWGGIDLDGTDDEIQIPSTVFAPIAGTKIASASIWCYPDSLASSYNCLFDAGTSTSTRQLSLFIESASVGYFGFANGASGTLTYSPTISTGEWQHIVVTCDGTTFRVYRNGTQCASSTTGLGTGIVASQWEIGGNPSTGGSQWDGKVDDLRLWSRCLSAAEVVSLYHASLSGYQAELRRVRRHLAFSAPAATFDPATFPYSNQRVVKPSPVNVVAY